MENIIKNTNLKDIIINNNSTQKWFPDSIEKIDSISFIFYKEEEAENFFNLFPKSVKANLGIITYYEEGIFFKYPVVQFNYINLKLDNRTGIANESAQKRRDIFFYTIKQNNINIKKALN